MFNKNLIGKTIPGQKSQYKITAKLGQGGFGETYLAEDVNNNEQCVVKLLKPNQHQHNLNKPDLQYLKELFKREAQQLNKLKHPQIPKLKDYFIINYKLLPIIKQDFYLVEEYIEGHELSQELPFSKKLDNDTVWYILHDILEILVFIQTQNLAHRDVTPANLIRRTSDNKLVLIDFGTVKEIGERTQRSLVIGTDPYMAMERKTGQVSFNTDIYSVGMIGIQGLTGFTLEKSDKDGIYIDDYYKIIWKDFAPNVSDELANIIDKMVHPDWRRHRYHDAKAALEALEEIRPKTPVQVINHSGYVNVEGLDFETPGNNIEILEKPKFFVFSQPQLIDFVNTILTLQATIEITPEPQLKQIKPQEAESQNNNIITENLLTNQFVITAGIITSLTFLGIGFTAVYLRKPEQEIIREELTQTYQHPEENMEFTIKYPESLQAKLAQPGDMEKVKFMLEQPPTQNDCPVAITVSVADLGEAITLKEFKKDAFHVIERDKLNSEIRHTSSRYTSSRLSDGDAYKITFTRKENGCTFKKLEKGTLAYKKGYFITYQAPTEEYKKFWPVVEKMIDSFKIKEGS
ncbi:MAG: serine/threonine protein kinase [Sphaerospermopsis sp. SIO1G2]|nr:serine/threonine protein kinase [Sphaerospermopsis sp. SIO1G2]